MGIFNKVFGKKDSSESLGNVLEPFVQATFLLIDKGFVMKNEDCIYAVKFYFMGAADMLCQTMNKDDFVFGKTCTDILEYIGFSKNEAFNSMSLFVEESMTERAQIFLQEGAKELKRFISSGEGTFGLQIVLQDHTCYRDRK